jgi:hypothetical protein
MIKVDIKLKFDKYLGIEEVSSYRSNAVISLRYC